MKTVLLISLLCSPVTALASDAYFVRFLSVGKSQGCLTILWRDDILFYNHTDSVATVRFLGVSTGPLPPRSETLALPPHRMISVNNSLVQWGQAGTLSDLRVVHLDIPSGVTAESRDEFYTQNSCILIQPPPLSLGKVSMPIFRTLTPSNIPQVI